MSSYQQQHHRVESPAQRRGVAAALAATAVFGFFAVGHTAVTVSRGSRA
jgi:hypothetical protein